MVDLGPVPVELLRSRPRDVTDHHPELLALDAGEQYRFGFSMDSCIGCHSCEVACAEQNGLPADTVWRRVGEIEGGTWPDTRRFHLSMSCNHCLEPACLAGCPTNAYEKLANGVVAHHAQDCIGCQYCTWNCPYSVPAFQADRRIVTKCDLCAPRLEEGRSPACVQACPTHAITVEAVDVQAWRADHSEADAPNLPPSSLTLSTTRIELPCDVPVNTFAGSDWAVRPEDPHWPLVVLTLATQVSVGVSLTAGSPADRVLAALAGAGALVASLFHLGRPWHAVKALRNLRRSWLSREVAAFGVYAALAASAVVVPAMALPAAAVGVAGVYASGRLYVVPGRPAWDSPWTLVAFFATAAATGPLLTGSPAVALVGIGASLLALGANSWRLRRDQRLESSGTLTLLWRRFRGLLEMRVALALVGVLAIVAGADRAAFAALLLAEGIGRYLFYVTVVPLNMPGGFFRRRPEHG